MPVEGCEVRVSVIDGSESKSAVWGENAVAALDKCHLNWRRRGLHYHVFHVVLGRILQVYSGHLHDILSCEGHVVGWDCAVV